MCRVKGRKEWKERRNHAREGAGGYVAERFSSSCLFHMIPTCPKKAHKAQLKGKVETKELYFERLILASGGDTKNK